MKKVLLIDSYSNIIKNRFELCVIASERAKAILFSNNSFGVNTKKEVCLALEEMKDDKIDIDAIKKNMSVGAIGDTSDESGFIDVSGSSAHKPEELFNDIELDFGMFADQNIDS